MVKEQSEDDSGCFVGNTLEKAGQEEKPGGMSASRREGGFNRLGRKQGEKWMS